MARVLSGILGVVLLITAGPSQAILIEVEPAAQSVDLSEQATVDINVSGLGDKEPTSLAGYNIDIGFDASILAFNSAVFGSGLDLGFGSLTFGPTTGTGTVNLGQSAFASPLFLGTLQPASFTLATLTFDTLATGLSPLSITANSVTLSTTYDFSGLVEASDVETAGGSVRVPEPSTLLLGFIGMLGLLFALRRNTPRASTAM